ncbi:MAG TPA: hypothetical protein VJM33_03035 [Microthrixaceae bacterium]|nr:hypothetical protein [Microthrixaceae bacterium]
MLVARYQLGPMADEVDAEVRRLVADDAVARLWARDHTLLSDSRVECADRMGWLDTMDASLAVWPELESAAEKIAAIADHVVLMGMGGSSLFPEVLDRTFGSAPGRPSLTVIDTTHPAAVAAVGAACPADRTFHLAASKSGSTVETRSHLAWFWQRSQDPSRFGVVTDPGSALGELARQRGFAHVWENDPDIGGRFSALSMFGMVPAALVGADGEALLEAADEARDVLAPLGDDGDLNVGLVLGAVLGVAARSGRDRLTFVLEDRIASFGSWLEQLIAESLGKNGVGVVPVFGEPAELVAASAERRVVVGIGDVELPDLVLADGDRVPTIHLGLEEATDLGAQLLLWEVATAFAGGVIGCNPFDQPDVEAAKVAARALLADPTTIGDTTPTVPIADALELVGPDDWVAVCAFTDPGSETTRELERARTALGRRLGVPTTFGVGPRFLHSTGQLHKGGRDDVVVIQVLDAGSEDLAIPEQPFTFGQLLTAQADGDLRALAAAGRRAVRVSVDDLIGLT